MKLHGRHDGNFLDVRGRNNLACHESKCLSHLERRTCFKSYSLQTAHNSKSDTMYEVTTCRTCKYTVSGIRHASRLQVRLQLLCLGSRQRTILNRKCVIRWHLMQHIRGLQAKPVKVMYIVISAYNSAGKNTPPSLAGPEFFMLSCFRISLIHYRSRFRRFPRAQSSVRHPSQKDQSRTDRRAVGSDDCSISS